METVNSEKTNSGNLAESPASTARPKPFSMTQKIGAVVAAVILMIVVAIGLLSRRSARAALTESTNRAAVPIVNVTSISPAKSTMELVLPGTTEPFIEAAIYARTNGYLKKWYFDIGSHVRKGQLLAEIETPELDQELKQAQEDLFTAEQNEQLAFTTAVRWRHLVSDDAVSKQEAEQYESDYKAKTFTTRAAAANVDRLEQLRSFENVYAPFDGGLLVLRRIMHKGRDDMALGAGAWLTNAVPVLPPAPITRMFMMHCLPSYEMRPEGNHEHCEVWMTEVRSEREVKQSSG